MHTNECYQLGKLLQLGTDVLFLASGDFSPANTEKVIHLQSSCPSLSTVSIAPASYQQ